MTAIVELAHTGSRAGPLAVLGIIVVVVGVILTLSARRAPRGRGRRDG